MTTLINYDYFKSTPGGVIQGIKGHRVPKGAVGGSNGSFRMKGDPPRIILYLNDNGKAYSLNIYRFVKAQSSCRVTEAYVNDILNQLIGKAFNNYDELIDTIQKNLK